MDKPTTKPESRFNTFSVRESLGSVEAMKKYDKYIKDHARRLKQLIREANGTMAPSGEWYDEG